MKKYVKLFENYIREDYKQHQYSFPRYSSKNYSYLNEEDEVKANVRWTELITKHKDGFISFIESLTGIVNQDPNVFCADIASQFKSVSGELDTLIFNIAVAEGFTAPTTANLESVIDSLHKRFNGGLGNAIVVFSKPIVKKYQAQNGEFYISLEILDALDKHLKTKYPTNGGKMVVLVREIIKKLELTIDSTCK